MENMADDGRDAGADGGRAASYKILKNKVRGEGSVGECGDATFYVFFFSLHPLARMLSFFARAACLCLVVGD